MGRPAHDGQPDEAEHHVEDDDGPADAQLVADVAGYEKDDACEKVRRRNEALRFADGEVQLLGEDQGQRVSQGVRQRRGVEGHHGVRPHLPVQTGS